MISFLLQMFSFKFRNECVENIISDFKNTKEESEKKEEAPMEDEMMASMDAPMMEAAKEGDAMMWIWAPPSICDKSNEAGSYSW